MKKVRYLCEEKRTMRIHRDRNAVDIGWRPANASAIARGAHLQFTRPGSKKEKKIKKENPIGWTLIQNFPLLHVCLKETYSPRYIFGRWEKLHISSKIFAPQSRLEGKWHHCTFFSFVHDQSSDIQSLWWLFFVITFAFLHSRNVVFTENRIRWSCIGPVPV